MLTGPQLHLMLNHLPIAGFVLMSPVLILTLALGKADYKRAGLLGIAIIGLLVLPAFWTGEPAEEGVEHLAGISEKLIEAHEEAAEIALALALTTSGVAAAAWFATRRNDALLRAAMPAITLMALGTAGVLSWVGHEGGKIRHPEIRGVPDATAVDPDSTKSETLDEGH